MSSYCLICLKKYFCCYKNKNRKKVKETKSDFNKVMNMKRDLDSSDDSKSIIINNERNKKSNLVNINENRNPIIVNNNYVYNSINEANKKRNYKLEEINNNFGHDLIDKNEYIKKLKPLGNRDNLLKEIKEMVLKADQKLKILDEREKQLSERERMVKLNEKKYKETIDENIKLKNKETQFNELLKKEKEEYLSLQKKQEKLYKEKLLKLKEKEDLLLKQKESLKNNLNNLESQKKTLEEEKKLFELSKLPNEIGLQNIGATCYMNATLQALSNSNLFTEFFLTKYHYNSNDFSKKMSNEMYKVLINLWSDNKKKGDYPPNDFKKALSEENPLFAGVQANDSKDLINFLLERFHQELNTAGKGGDKNNDKIINVNQMDEQQTLKAFLDEYFNSNKSIILDCFYGILETRSKCSGCNVTKYNFQIYSFLEFPLQEVNNYMFQNGRRVSLVNNDGTNPDINLYECFDYYQKIDLMNGQNQMFCNICNGNRDTYYGTTVYSLPNYLIINLNRGKGATYSCKVIFPEMLNLLNYVSFKNGVTAMKLYAVICHLGPSSMSGHFIAYCKHRINNKWYKYNDSFVTECTQPNEYYNGMPYILFYKAI